MTQPIIVLAFDALDRMLVRRLAAEGRMPHFERVLDAGLLGDIVGFPGFYIGTTWVSFQTGLSPANHGSHWREQIKLGTYEAENISRSERLESEPFWRALSDAGKRVAILDVPNASVVPDFNGIELFEWGAHDFDRGKVLSWPRSLAREVIDRFGEYPVPYCDGERDAAGYVRLRDALVKGVRVKAALTSDFLRREPWDLFVQVFTEAHCVGHQCWHIHDRHHPRHDEDGIDAIGDPVVDVYVALDGALGSVLENAPSEAMVLVVTNLGMEASHCLTFLADEILARLGVVEVPLADKTRRSGRSGPWRTVDDGLTRAWQMLPNWARDYLKPVRNGLRGTIDRRTSSTKTYLSGGKCFRVASDLRHAAIRVNLEGREPAGSVKPGAELDAFCAQLESDFRDVINVATGRSIVQRVIHTRHQRAGPYGDRMPDLLVEFRRDGPVRAVSSKKIGKLPAKPLRYRTGDHTPDGLLVALGPGVRPGRLSNGVSMLDFAPTICDLLGVQPPENDGRIIPELIEAANGQ